MDAVVDRAKGLWAPLSRTTSRPEASPIEDGSATTVDEVGTKLNTDFSIRRPRHLPNPSIRLWELVAVGVSVLLRRERRCIWNLGSIA